MIMRYGSIMLAGGQFLSVTRRSYGKLITEFGVEIEGFASPLNSQMLFYGRKFCSLFPDTDKIFGSLGSFFDQDFTGKKITCNPPFINSVMEDAIEHIKKFKTGLFIVCVPTWTEENWYKECQKICSEERVYAGGTYNYQHDEKIVPVKFPTTLFVVGKTTGTLKNIDML
jgi:hypothetical protein